MVEQARPYFNEELREHIAFLARELAGQDEVAFIEYATAKGRLVITAAHILLFAPKNDSSAELVRRLNEDAAIMEEVMRQAQAIRQLTGMDSYCNHLLAQDKIGQEPLV
ncbi:hypothetical protein A2V61_04410 [Candidatus Woesebacteria bacterium RBG_19FT_COMBO_47_8]|uniref:Uncharacterized protein n=1 Tax=Candidatus Woesebacteria bacterium RBG_13_46_13 TaxID=1802479 RepID=A0A1F7X4P4_9BACT|nr:MAG: hypothetical protein A2Y68_01255 [Candidatus Woesebacteria bacterium RBG_13_46_13]OGM17908.1 MAG: hypothetical protein A2V61_04410 [Candidatus Woesebacteria bacterium RBG_19FT_COMBO_47_8]